VTVEVVGEEGRTAAASVIVRVRDDGLGCLAPLPGLPVEKPTALTLLHPLTRSPYGSGLSQAHEWSPGDSDALLAKDRADGLAKTHCLNPEHRADAAPGGRVTRGARPDRPRRR
jgi:hypothetical protein